MTVSKPAFLRAWLPRVRSCSRTRCPGRCGWGRRRGSAPWAFRSAGPPLFRRRGRARSCCSGRGFGLRTPPRRCPPSCIPGGCPGARAVTARRPRRPIPVSATRSGDPIVRCAWRAAAARRSARVPRRVRCAD